MLIGLCGNISIQAEKSSGGISYNDLFMKYPTYLNNSETETAINNACNAYMNVLANYDEGDEYISALKSGASDGLSIIIRNIGSALGLTDSYYDTCMDKATLEFIKNVYSDEWSISRLSIVKDAAKDFKWIKNAADLSTGTIDIIASNMKNLKKSDVEEITKTIKGNYSKVLDPATTTLDLAKYVATACVIEDVQIEMIDLLLEKSDRNGELYKGLTRLRNDMTSGIAGYTLKTFIENKALKEMSSKIMKYGWSALDISTGSVVIGSLIVKAAVWVLFDVIFPHPDADTVISNMILTAYVNELSVSVINQRALFNQPFFTSDMDDYETLFTMYLACIDATMDSTKALAETTGDEQALENAQTTFKDLLPDYDTYIDNCTQVVSNIPEKDRIKRTWSSSEYITVSSGIVSVGEVPEEVNYTDSLPLTSENSTLWDVYVSGGTLATGSNVNIPDLNVYSWGTLKLYDTLNIEYNITQSGNIFLNGNNLIVGWNYTNNGTLHMENDADYLLVYGDYTQNYSYTSGYITAGTFEIKGNMVDCAGYRPTGTHKTIISGNTKQDIDLYYSTSGIYNYRYNGWFNILEITNISDEGVTFTSAIIKKELYSNGANITNPSSIYLTDNATIRGNKWNYDSISLSGWKDDANMTFNCDVNVSRISYYIYGEWTYLSDTVFNSSVLNGKVKIDSDAKLTLDNSQNINGDLTNNGTIDINSPLSIMGNLISSGTINMYADVNLSGDLQQYSHIYLNGNNLIVGGNYTNNGTLHMENDADYLLVYGDYTQNYSYTSGYITAGTFEIKGNMVDCAGYRPTGTHKTIISGNSKQNIDLNYSSSGLSYYNYNGWFNILEIANTSDNGITFGSNTNVSNKINQPVGTILNGNDNVKLQNKIAFVDYGELNRAINLYNGNAENVIPTWLDYENYSASNTKVNKIIVEGILAERTYADFCVLMPYGTSTITKEQILVETEDESATYIIESAETTDNWIITVTSKNGIETKEYHLAIDYDPINHVKGIFMSETEKTINVGDNFNLSVSFMPEDSTYKTLSWESSNNNVVTVENGVVTAVNKGKAIITATSNNGFETTCEITVLKPSSAVRLNKTKVYLDISDLLQLSAIMTPIDSTDDILWNSSDTEILEITNKGVVKAINKGTAIITATTSSGATAQCTVVVQNNEAGGSLIKFSNEQVVLAPDDAKELNVEGLPDNITETELIWTSSNEDVAIVNQSGIVTAVSNGFATIKAYTSNGLTAECVVKVVSATGTSVILSNTKASPSGIAQVKASIVRNPGISGYKFTVDYDDTLLTPVSVEANTEFGGTLTTNLDDTSRTEFNILWYSDNNVYTNSDLFTINFEVKDSAVYGDTSAISLNYGAKDICNTSGDSIALYIQDSTISIAEPLPGDICEDDDVSVFDLTLLARYITGLEAFTDRQLEAADVNDDNEVDIKDVVTLAQYIVGWTGVQLMSFFRGIRSVMGVNVGTASVNEAFEAEIPVYISNNPGVAGFRYVIEHSDDLEILSITPTMDGIKDKFQTNLGQQGNNDLIVSWYNTDNMTENGELFKIKVRLTNPDADISQISIKSADNNMCNENKQDVIAEYEDGYVMSSNYIIANQTITDTTFGCELYFDNTFAEQTAKAILGFYDEQHKLVQFALKDITVKPGKVDLNFDIEDKPYSTYKLMLWEGLNSMRPLVEVK